MLRYEFVEEGEEGCDFGVWVEIEVLMISENLPAIWWVIIGLFGVERKNSLGCYYGGWILEIVIRRFCPNLQTNLIMERNGEKSL